MTNKFPGQGFSTKENLVFSAIFSLFGVGIAYMIALLFNIFLEFGFEHILFSYIIIPIAIYIFTFISLFIATEWF